MNINNSTETDFFRVAAYQGPIFEKSPQISLEMTIETMNTANNQLIDVLCMPETFLHGLLATKEEALDYSINLSSREFDQLCSKFSHFKHTTLLLGLNEREGDFLFNTVVVIEQGKYVGKYRKAYYDDDYFYQGNAFPVFSKRGIKYSIIICYDSWFREPALISALNGADILFCPSFNRIRNEPHMIQRLEKRTHCITRAYDTQCWFVMSDIIWKEEDNKRICPGFACILDTNGNLLVAGNPYQEMLLTHAIPLSDLDNRKRKKRLFGNAELFNVLQKKLKSHHQIDCKK